MDKITRSVLEYYTKLFPGARVLSSRQFLDGTAGRPYEFAPNNANNWVIEIK